MKVFTPQTFASLLLLTFALPTSSCGKAEQGEDDASGADAGPASEPVSSKTDDDDAPAATNEQGDEPSDGNEPTADESADPSELEEDVLFGGGVDTTVVVDDDADQIDPGEEDMPVDVADPIVRCAEATGVGDAPVIDDFEDGDFTILEQDGRDATWYSYNSEEDSELQSFEILVLDGLPTGGERALHTSGPALEWAGVGAGFRWAAQNESGVFVDCMYDATVYEGVRFWARGAPGTVRFTISTPEVLPLDAGGSCESDCYNNHGVDFDVTEDWVQYFLPFADMEQPDYGPQVGALDPSRLRTLQFEFPSQLEFDLFVDDLAFYQAGDELTDPDGPVDDASDDEPIVDPDPNMPDEPLDAGISEPQEPDPPPDAGDAGL